MNNAGLDLELSASHASRLLASARLSSITFNCWTSSRDHGHDGRRTTSVADSLFCLADRGHDGRRTTSVVGCTLLVGHIGHFRGVNRRPSVEATIREPFLHHLHKLLQCEPATGRQTGPNLLKQLALKLVDASLALLIERCLELSVLAYSMFNAVYQAPELSTALFRSDGRTDLLHIT